MTFQRIAVVASLLGCASPAAAQDAFGLGVRMAMVRGDVQADPAATAERFTGGQLRARISPHTSVEVSLDHRSQDSADLTQRGVDYPLQGSLLFFPVRSTISPYVLAGVGWYTHIDDTLAAGTVVESSTTRKVGYHAGFGGEMKIGKYTGIHADYRYTFVHFGDSTTPLPVTASTAATTGLSGVASRLVPSYDGSMWTAGVTFYF
jgi:hypothetical protein